MMSAEFFHYGFRFSFIFLMVVLGSVVVVMVSVLRKVSELQYLSVSFGHFQPCVNST